MEHVEPNMATVRPGKRGGLIWQFDEASVVDSSCLVPRHFEAEWSGASKSSRAGRPACHRRPGRRPPARVRRRMPAASDIPARFRRRAAVLSAVLPAG